MALERVENLAAAIGLPITPEPAERSHLQDVSLPQLKSAKELPITHEQYHFRLAAAEEAGKLVVATRRLAVWESIVLDPSDPDTPVEYFQKIAASTVDGEGNRISDWDVLEIEGLHLFAIIRGRTFRRQQISPKNSDEITKGDRLSLIAQGDQLTTHKVVAVNKPAEV